MIRILPIVKVTTAIIAVNTMMLLSGCEEPLDESDLKKAEYAIGVGMGEGLATDLKNVEGTELSMDNEIIIQGFIDGLAGQSKISDEDRRQIVTEYQKKLAVVLKDKRARDAQKQKSLAEANLKEGRAYLASNAKEDGVETLDSGLQYKILTQGKGESPSEGDRVSVHYVGTLINGDQFDNSHGRGAPALLPVSGVIDGWSEIIQLMKPGSKWQVAIPPEKAYGEAARPKIPANSVLLFELELLEVLVST